MIINSYYTIYANELNQIMIDVAVRNTFITTEQAFIQAAIHLTVNEKLE